MTILPCIAVHLLVLQSAYLSFAASRQDYIKRAIDAANLLCSTSYNPANGLFDGSDGKPGWWTSANPLTTLANLAALNPSTLLPTATQIFTTTHARAPFAPVAATYNVQPGTFLDDFYDDEGWWALAWLRAYDLTRNATYLATARALFDDIDAAPNGHCGGRPWTRVDAANQINSITNELYFAVAAALANRVSDDDGGARYAALAHYQADWFANSGLLGSGGNGLLVDSLDVGACAPNTSSAVWTYTQGVILGAWAEMHALTGEARYLDAAHVVARGATAQLVDAGGILTERGYPGVQEGAEQFKGVFVRNLMDLHRVAPDKGYVDFLTRNADAVWERGRAGDGRVGVNWQGPVRGVDAVSHAAGLDCLVAAAAVAE